MIGRPDSLAGGAGKAWLTGYERSTMGDSLRANGVPIVADPRPAQDFFQRSDNIAFARLGIVAHTWSTFNLHTDYHEVTDDVSKVDFDHMARVIDAGARAVWVLANGDTPAAALIGHCRLLGALGEQLRREALPLGDPLHLDGHRVQ
jgi:uncharacterized protein YecE (DUF72 family)